MLIPHLEPVAVLSIAVFFASGCVAAAPAGVTGQVLLSPARPGPQRIGDPGARPYPGAVVRLRDVQGRARGRAVSDGDGRFSLDAPAGTYTLEVEESGAAYPRCEPVGVDIGGSQHADVVLRCDSGMR